MKKELIFIWIKSFRCLNEQEFNFSPNYQITFNSSTEILSIKKIDCLNIFNKNNILNVSAIIGENGSGKTSLLYFLNSLSMTPLLTTNDKKYEDYFNDRNNQKSYVAIYLIDDDIKVINRTASPIAIEHDKFQYTVSPITNEEYQHNDLIGNLTHIYFTNSEYAENSNMFRGGKGIDYISIFNNALDYTARDFYKRSVCYDDVLTDNYLQLQYALIDGKTAKDFQQILDILFLNSINNKKEQTIYLGKQIKTIKLNFISCKNYLYKKFAGDNSQNNFKVSVLNKIRDFNTQINNLKICAISDGLIINLAFELFFIYNLKLRKYTNIENVFNCCTRYIQDHIHDKNRKEYYTSSIKEINSIRKILDCAPLIKSKLPKSDLAYNEYYEVTIRDAGKILKNITKNNGVSFVAKYLHIQGLEISSGERALLNLSSRIGMLDYLFKIIGQTYTVQENTLLLFDEIDLYVHPNAQKMLLQSLLTQINEMFKGKNIQVIISSHSPIVLSDIPREHTTYLTANSDGQTIAINGKEKRQTFAANIPSLYKDSFFIEGGLGVGDYSIAQINHVAKLLNAQQDLNEEQLKYCSQLISLIGEPIIKRKLEEMLSKHNATIRQSNPTVDSHEKAQYLMFLKKQRALIDTEIKRLERENND